MAVSDLCKEARLGACLHDAMLPVRCVSLWVESVLLSEHLAVLLPAVANTHSFRRASDASSSNNS